MSDQGKEMERLEGLIKSMELRLSALESAFLKTEKENLFISEEQDQIQDAVLTVVPTEEESKGLESQIGRFGLAWTGNIVLLFGITFFMQYLIIQGNPVFSSVLGFIAVVSIYFLADYLKKTNDHLAFMFKLNSQILLFYVILRLHFFSASPLLPGKTISLILLLLIVTLQVYLAVRNRSQVYAALSVIFALTTAFVGETTHLMLSLIVITAFGSAYYYYKFRWGSLLVATIILTYASFFLWMAGNPVMGNSMHLLRDQPYGAIYLFFLGSCFSVLLLMRTKDDSSDDFLAGIIFLNGILFTILLTLVVLVFFSTDYVGLFSVITICCLVYSVLLHSRSDWKFASAFYALYGFMAMSIALYGLVGLPRIYLFLAVQSLVVVSMALWFRNRLIVVMNSLLFLTILFIYITTSKSSDWINFSFAMVALISARIINWKRSRLQIKTDMIRNLYMLAGFFMVLFLLGNAVPKQFITLSWTMAALLYFLTGYILKNVKYRYMALGTMISATFYFFIIDLAKIEIIYRVFALLFLAAISIGISIYYTNRIKKQDN